MDDDPEIRPLPDPPRCRGVLLPDGNYTGCAFGYCGKVNVFPGFSEMHAYTCRECGRGVQVTR
jgi:hypothetical protein